MSRFRTVHTRIWGDEKFRNLSRPKANGRDCFLYYLTAKETTILPGAIPSGPAALAESLRWPVRAFLQAAAEVEAAGLAVSDWSAGLVWVPNAIRYNRPPNPNVAKAWGKAFVELPDCALKSRVLVETESFLKEFPEPFAKAFREGFGNTGAVAGTVEQEQQHGAEAFPKTPGGKLFELESVKADKRPKALSRQQVLFALLAEERRQCLGAAWTADEYSVAQINSFLKAIVDFRHPESGEGYREEAIVGAFRAFLQNDYFRTGNPPFRIRQFAAAATFSEHVAKFAASTTSTGAEAWS